MAIRQKSSRPSCADGVAHVVVRPHAHAARGQDQVRVADRRGERFPDGCRVVPDPRQDAWLPSRLADGGGQGGGIRVVDLARGPVGRRVPPAPPRWTGWPRTGRARTATSAMPSDASTPIPAGVRGAGSETSSPARVSCPARARRPQPEPTPPPRPNHRPRSCAPPARPCRPPAGAGPRWRCEPPSRARPSATRSRRRRPPRVISSRPGRSAARTANPSMAELANGGTSEVARIVRDAGTRPRAASSETVSTRALGRKGQQLLAGFGDGLHASRLVGLADPAPAGVGQERGSHQDEQARDHGRLEPEVRRVELDQVRIGGKHPGPGREQQLVEQGEGAVPGNGREDPDGQDGHPHPTRTDDQHPAQPGRIGPQDAPAPGREGEGHQLEQDEDPDQAADVLHVGAAPPRRARARRWRRSRRSRHPRRCPTRSRR